MRGWAIANGLHWEKVRRAAKGLNGVNLETLEEIAGAVGRSPWMLLLPGMRVPLPEASPKAAELAALYDAINDPAARRHAYAIARLALTDQIPDPTHPDEALEPHEPDTLPTPTRRVAR